MDEDAYGNEDADEQADDGHARDSADGGRGSAHEGDRAVMGGTVGEPSASSSMDDTRVAPLPERDQAEAPPPGAVVVIDDDEVVKSELRENEAPDPLPNGHAAPVTAPAADAPAAPAMADAPPVAPVPEPPAPLPKPYEKSWSDIASC